MRQRCDVFNASYLQAGVLQIQNRLFAAGTGAFHFYFNFHHAGLAGLLRGVFGGPAGGKRGALAAPLKPTVPADAHEMVSPLGSVIVTMVLLNVDLMCAMPRVTPLRIFFLTADGFALAMRWGFAMF